jgi:hypothetical protein
VSLSIFKSIIFVLNHCLQVEHSSTTGIGDLTEGLTGSSQMIPMTGKTEE